MQAHWRTKISTNSREWEERNRLLRVEKDIMSRHYQNLKAEMCRFRTAEINRLKQLCTNSDNCIHDLEGKIKLASRILRLSELNRKMETEQEKVTPFYKPMAAVEEEGDGAELGMEKAAPKEAVGEPPTRQRTLPFYASAASAVTPGAPTALRLPSRPLLRAGCLLSSRGPRARALARLWCATVSSPPPLHALSAPHP